MNQRRNVVPFLDLVTPHLQLEEELVTGFRACLHNAHFVGGEAVERFEHEFAAYGETDHCVGVASGTDAVRFALMAAGVEPGDAVITVPNTFIATTEAITQAGALPLFVEIEERTYTLDAKALRRFEQSECHLDSAARRLIHRKSNRPVTAVVPVHLYGQTADMDPILELAEEYCLQVIEDACQAHGAAYYSAREQRWRKAGSMGRAGAFSFYPGKNLGACGEAGAVTTNDERVAAHIRMLRDHGQTRKYYHDLEGYNGRLDTVQAAILLTKLKHLEGWNQQRRAAAANYGGLLRDVSEVSLPVTPEWALPVHHLYVVRVPGRETLQAELAAAGVGTGIHYPIPLHLQKAYAHLGYAAGDFPVSERVAGEILSLPMYPQLTSADQAYVAGKLTEAAAAVIEQASAAR
jgi:dTDP-4-amino-4,6-dideoxygalactose transaminase